MYWPQILARCANPQRHQPARARTFMEKSVAASCHMTVEDVRLGLYPSKTQLNPINLERR